MESPHEVLDARLALSRIPLPRIAVKDHICSHCATYLFNRFRNCDTELSQTLTAREGRALLPSVRPRGKVPGTGVGATGAGKSVALNAILISLLYKASPDEVKLILVDPKRLELGLYSDIPHLLTPIVTDPKRASYVLKGTEITSLIEGLASLTQKEA